MNLRPASKPMADIRQKSDPKAKVAGTAKRKNCQSLKQKVEWLFNMDSFPWVRTYFINLNQPSILHSEKKVPKCMDWQIDTLGCYGRYGIWKKDPDILATNCIFQSVSGAKLAESTPLNEDLLGKTRSAILPSSQAKCPKRKWLDSILQRVCKESNRNLYPLTLYTSRQLTWQWRILIFNSIYIYIFKWFMFHCYIGLPECNYQTSCYYSSWSTSINMTLCEVAIVYSFITSSLSVIITSEALKWNFHPETSAVTQDPRNSGKYNNWVWNAIKGSHAGQEWIWDDIWVGEMSVLHPTKLIESTEHREWELDELARTVHGYKMIISKDPFSLDHEWIEPQVVSKLNLKIPVSFFLKTHLWAQGSPSKLLKSPTWDGCWCHSKGNVGKFRCSRLVPQKHLGDSSIPAHSCHSISDDILGGSEDETSSGCIGWLNLPKCFSWKRNDSKQM